MNGAPASTSLTGTVWKWWICGLLLLATTINYMDRQILANAASRITTEMQLTNEQYGRLELCFGLAFATGCVIFGFLADKVSVRWLYPTVLLCWSAVGVATGMVEDYTSLLVCRTLLGVFEAGHWPCALKTTQRLLTRKERGLGNSILQSGASVGAILTPLIMAFMLTDTPGSWRTPFLVIGGGGMIWIVFWLGSIWSDLPSEEHVESAPNTASGGQAGSLWSVVYSRKFLVLFVIVVCINGSWALLRVWLPKFLQEGRGYDQYETLYMISLYYAATDVGCLLAGGLTLLLQYGGFNVHGSRSMVFLVFSLITATTTLIPFLPRGPLLVAVLMIVAAGSLGVFPCYYSFTQELSVRHQGKISGILGCSAWVVSSPMHSLFGMIVDETHSFDLGMALAGWAPLVACIVLLTVWPAHEVEDLPKPKAAEIE